MAKGRVAETYLLGQILRQRQTLIAPKNLATTPTPVTALSTTYVCLEELC